MKNLLRYLFQSSKLPQQGSVYTINKPRSAYDGMTGIVIYHSDGKRFAIECQTCTVCNIKP